MENSVALSNEACLRYKAVSYTDKSTKFGRLHSFRQRVNEAIAIDDASKSFTAVPQAPVRPLFQLYLCSWLVRKTSCRTSHPIRYLLRLADNMRIITRLRYIDSPPEAEPYRH